MVWVAGVLTGCVAVLVVGAVAVVVVLLAEGIAVTLDEVLDDPPQDASISALRTSGAKDLMR